MTRMSDLATALANRPRTCHVMPVALTGLLGKPVAHIAFRVVTKLEQDEAILAAIQYTRDIANRAGVDQGLVQHDRDIATDARTAFILCDACRDATDPRYPAFPGPRWMVEHLSTDEIAVLLNCYAEVLRATGPIDLDLSNDRVTALATGLATLAQTDAPNAILSRYTREQVSEIAIRLSVLLRDEREAHASGPGAGARGASGLSGGPSGGSGGPEASDAPTGPAGALTAPSGGSGGPEASDAPTGPAGALTAPSGGSGGPEASDAPGAGGA